MARRIKIPGTDHCAIHMGSAKEADRHEAIIRARHEFCLQWMKERGLGENVEDLTFEQVLDIREEPGWQDPLREAN